MRLSLLLKPEHVFLDVPARTREEILSFVSRRLEMDGAVRNGQEVMDLLLERERLGATVTGNDGAIPHCSVAGLKGIVAAFLRSEESVAFGSEHEESARIFFVVLSPREQPGAHLQVLANIARVLRSPQARRSLVAATTGEELLASLTRFEASQ